jgi:hypothetical protein
LAWKDAFVVHLQKKIRCGLIREEEGQTQDLAIGDIRSYGMYNGEGEFAFSEIFGKAFVIRVLYLDVRVVYERFDWVQAHIATLKVHVVVSYLEIDADEVNQRDVVSEKKINA